MADLMPAPERERATGFQVVTDVLSGDGNRQLDAVHSREQRFTVAGTDQGSEDLVQMGLMMLCPNDDTAARFGRRL